MSAYDDYIANTINPILRQLTIEVAKTKPENPVTFLIDLLSTRLGVNNSMSEKEELRILRQELARLKQKKAGSENEKTDSEDDEIEDIQPKKQSARSGVSAEAYGQWNKKGTFKPPVHHKTLEQRNRIIAKLSTSFMFVALDDRDKEIVIEAMKECSFPAKSDVIKQGADGAELFIVDTGILSCYKNIKGEEKYLKDYHPGEAFGELALLYNAPRAATIIAKTDSILWSLDRDTFNHIVKSAAVKRREKYEAFLSKIDLLADMDPYERSQLADAFLTSKFNQGDYIIKEGEEGNNFYIIEEGEAIATKIIHKGHAAEQVKHYKPGDYFGELALLKNQPRAANVVATQPLKCVSLDRHSFKRLLGPVESILVRNSKKYEEIIASLV